jgi:hypothetical protein
MSKGGYAKIYESILDSSVWSEAAATRLVWITMLAMADQDGHVEASLGGLARRANVTREECEQALAVLSNPDPDDKSGVDDGRRIQKVERGWSITNHRRYREMRTKKQIEGAQRVRRHRAKSVTCNDVTSDNAPSASASAFVSEGGVGETLSQADLRRPMTASWQPSSKTIASLRTGMIPDWAIPELVGRFRSHFVGAAHDIATDAEWNQRCSKWAWKDWGEPSKRPQKPKPESKAAGAQSAAAHQARLKAEAAARHAELAAQAEADGLDVSGPPDVPGIQEAVGE